MRVARVEARRISAAHSAAFVLKIGRSNTGLGRRQSSRLVRERVLTVIVVVSLVAAQMPAADAKFSRAMVYFVGWDVVTRVAMSPDQVRKVASDVISVGEPERVATLVSWLKLGELKPRREELSDSRLVIDLFDQDGKRVSFHVSRFDLISEDGQRGHPIDAAFRRRFEGLKERWRAAA